MKVVMGSDRNVLTFPCVVKLCSSLVERYEVQNFSDYVIFIFVTLLSCMLCLNRT